MSVHVYIRQVCSEWRRTVKLKPLENNYKMVISQITISTLLIFIGGI